MATGGLELELVDARSRGLVDNVRIELNGLDLTKTYRQTLAIDRTLALTGIEAGTFTRYQITLRPGNYRVVSFVLRIQPRRTNKRDRIRFPVDPGRVTGIQAPAYEQLPPALQSVLLASDVDTHPHLAGPDLYDALDPRRKACLLNIYTKAANTHLDDGSTCFDRIGGLRKLRGDRFFARASGALREEVQNARQVFTPVSGALHHIPEPGYTPAGSWKSNDHHGNLQLTFFRKGETGDDYLIDADIDEAQGIQHGFEVARNHFTNHETNPYDVREVLIRHQQLDPGYDFVFADQPQVLVAHA